MVVTPEEFLDWKQHNVTEAFMKGLKRHREVMKEDYISGLYENGDFAEGKALAIKEILEMTYEEMMEMLSEK